MGGMPAMPGRYSVSLSMVTREGIKELTSDMPFNAESLNLATFPAEDKAEVAAFQSQVAELAGAMNAARNFTAELQKKVVLIKQTLHNTAGTPGEMMQRAIRAEKELEDIVYEFEGPEAKASSEEIPPTDVPLNTRLRAIIYATYRSTSGTTRTQLDSYAILAEEFPGVLAKLRSIDEEIRGMDDELDAIGAPWTPGRFPNWQ